MAQQQLVFQGTSGLDLEICQDFCLDTGGEERSWVVGIREVRGQPEPVG